MFRAFRQVFFVGACKPKALLHQPQQPTSSPQHRLCMPASARCACIKDSTRNTGTFSLDHCRCFLCSSGKSSDGPHFMALKDPSHDCCRANRRSMMFFVAYINFALGRNASPLVRLDPWLDSVLWVGGRRGGQSICDGTLMRS